MTTKAILFYSNECNRQNLQTSQLQYHTTGLMPQSLDKLTLKVSKFRYYIHGTTKVLDLDVKKKKSMANDKLFGVTVSCL